MTPTIPMENKIPRPLNGVFPSGGILDTMFNAYATVFIAFILVAVTWYVLYKTKFGLHLRSCGEHPQASDSAGINVYKMRYIGTIISGSLAAFGGFIYGLVVRIMNTVENHK